VIDAAGAIYVIGGCNLYSGFTYYKDVWVSTDGGARPDLVGGGSAGRVLQGYQGGTQGY
jgi:hypothetical protein